MISLFEKHKYRVPDFFDQMNPIMKENGFDFKSSLKSYQKTENDFVFRLEFSSTHGIEVILDTISIRVPKVENIANIVFDIKPRNYSKTIFLITHHITKNFSSNRFFITKGSELQNAIKKLTEVYHIYASPYFKKYSTLEDLHILLNEESLDANENKEFFNNPLELIVKALIIAKLLDRADYSDIKKRHTYYYKSRIETKYHQEFDIYLKRMENIDFKRYMI